MSTNGLQYEGELKALETRLGTEKDQFVKSVIQKEVDRLKKAKKEPSQYEQYQKELREIQKYLQYALDVMNKVPFYVNSTKGKKGTKKKGK